MKEHWQKIYPSIFSEYRTTFFKTVFQVSNSVKFENKSGNSSNNGMAHIPWSKSSKGWKLLQQNNWTLYSKRKSISSNISSTHWIFKQNMINKIRIKRRKGRINMRTKQEVKPKQKISQHPFGSFSKKQEFINAILVYCTIL